MLLASWFLYWHVVGSWSVQIIEELLTLVLECTLTCYLVSSSHWYYRHPRSTNLLIQIPPVQETQHIDQTPNNRYNETTLITTILLTITVSVKAGNDAFDPPTCGKVTMNNAIFNLLKHRRLTAHPISTHPPELRIRITTSYLQIIRSRISHLRSISTANARLV